MLLNFNPRFAEISEQMNYLDFAYMEFRYNYFAVGGTKYCTKRNCLNNSGQSYYYSSCQQIYQVIKQVISD